MKLEEKFELILKKNKDPKKSWVKTLEEINKSRGLDRLTMANLIGLIMDEMSK